VKITTSSLLINLDLLAELRRFWGQKIDNFWDKAGKLKVCSFHMDCSLIKKSEFQHTEVASDVKKVYCQYYQYDEGWDLQSENWHWWSWNIEHCFQKNSLK
jgi:hypothetical protein